LLRRLRSKLLTLGVSLVVATQLGTLIYLVMIVDRGVTETATSNLETGDARLSQFMRRRTTSLRNSISAAATDRQFIMAYAARDTRKITSALTKQVKILDADFAVLLDQHGSILATTGEQVPKTMSLSELVIRATDEDTVRFSIDLDGVTYEIVTIQVADQRPAAWISVAFAVDDRLAMQVKDQTGLDITLLSTRDGATILIATSLAISDSSRTTVDIETEFAGLDLRPANSGRLSIAGQAYITRQRPFIHGSKKIMILLQEPVADATVPYEASRKVTIALGLFALLIALIGATTLSREVTRALQRFTATSRRIGAGDYSQTVSADENEELAELAAAVNAMQADIAKREELSTYEVQFDRVTGLPNRFLAVQRLQHGIKKIGGGNTPISLMILSLNCLTEINAAFGHDIGDAVLTQAAEQLRSNLGSSYTLARLEGDDFLIIMEGVKPSVARETAEDLLRSVCAGISVRDVNISVHPSIGICNFPDSGTEPEQLLLRAAIAKDDAGQTSEKINIYQNGKEDRHARQLAILGDLKRAVRNDELKLYLQPKVNLADGNVCGAEALARWDHPTLGFLPPRDFISIAEHSGNMSLISHWALATAIRECRLWIEDGLDLPVSVNLSSTDLQDPGLASFVLNTLRDHDLDPRHLLLEISEQVLVHSFDQATVVIQSLQDMGIRISIDDFGTGYASLARIKHLPADELQIAREFVKELPDNRKDVAIVRSAIDLAHSLDMLVSAKGVESRPAMSWLADQGCKSAQGYFISRPMPAETFSQWISHYNVDVTAYVSVLEAISR
jgi:diguanylate cyclase (GGDEF)-like protein